jgi:hypothetical protein
MDLQRHLKVAVALLVVAGATPSFAQAGGDDLGSAYFVTTLSMDLFPGH